MPVSGCFALLLTVVRLRLCMMGSEGSPFTFAAGQWVDFHIPSVDTVGGYSITSLPEQLPLLELAVKASDHPPAAWVTARVRDRASPNKSSPKIELNRKMLYMNLQK